MKLNLHVIKEDLGTECSYSKISEDESLTLVGAKLLGKLDQPPEKDMLYISTVEELRQYPFAERINSLVITNTDLPCTIQKNTNFIATSKNLDKFGVFTKILNIFGFYTRWESDLINAVLHSDDLAKLLQLGQKVFGNPIVLFDTNMISLAKAGEENIPNDAPIWNEVLVSGHTDIYLLPFFKKNVYTYNQILKSKKAFTFTLPDIDCKCFHANIFHNNIRFGSLNMTEILTPLTKKTTSVANYFISFITMALERSGLFQNTVSEMEQIVDFILSDNQCEENYLKYILDKFGWTNQDKYRIYIIGHGKNIIEKGTDLYLYHFQKNIKDCQAFKYNSYIILIQNLTMTNDQSHPEGLQHLLNILDYYCGVSTPFYGFKNLTIFHSQAKAAYDLGLTFNHNNRISLYSDLALEHVMSLIKDNIDLSTLCHTSIMELHRQDLQNNTDYVYSLFMYLSCGMNLIKTADQLFIHRNTLVYRLNKILDIIGRDALEQPNNTLTFLLSCWIVNYLSSI